jgi:hypothetical protein
MFLYLPFLSNASGYFDRLNSAKVEDVFSDFPDIVPILYKSFIPKIRITIKPKIDLSLLKGIEDVYRKN